MLHGNQGVSPTPVELVETPEAGIAVLNEVLAVLLSIVSLCATSCSYRLLREVRRNIGCLYMLWGIDLV